MTSFRKNYDTVVIIFCFNFCDKMRKNYGKKIISYAKLLYMFSENNGILKILNTGINSNIHRHWMLISTLQNGCKDKIKIRLTIVVQF